MEIQKVLIIGGHTSPFEQEQLHYSGTKDINLAIGFRRYCKSVFMVSKKDTETHNGIQFVPLSDISFEFLDSFDLILFTREQFIETILVRNKDFEKYIFNYPDRHAILVCRMGSSEWMNRTRWGRKQLYKHFDIHLPQTKSFASKMKADNRNDPHNKIYHSPMAVPTKLPEKKESPFIKHKYNLVYMGRMRHNPSRMPDMVKIMNGLGDDFHLNILPGTFSKPTAITGRNKFGPEVQENFEWLVEYFSKASNITVHKPVPWGEHWNYLQHSDYAIDFSPNSKVAKHPAGNAKLLEYMAVGLPVIVEVGPGNLELVRDCDGGIIIDQGSGPSKYIQGIKEATTTKFDRKRISAITIKRQNWNVRAKEILTIIDKVNKNK